MDRREHLLRDITPEQKGIEIGPYHSPLAPKRDGFQCLSLDIADAPTLRRNASADPNIPRNAIQKIEEVDLVGSSSAIARLVAGQHALGTFDYVLSSHNLEHMPDPIRFLRGCEEVLKPGGVVVMAIPDKRTCFDYFRPHSSTTDLLQAYFEERERPTPAQVFATSATDARYMRAGGESITFELDDDPSNVTPLEKLEEAFAAWKGFLAHPDREYRDAHCWVFTPASLELILRDLEFLGLIRPATIEVSSTIGHEFYTYLRSGPPPGPGTRDRRAFYERRRQILHRVIDETGENSLSRFTGDIGELRTRMRREVEAMRSSWSWRVTAPLRFLLDRLRRHA
jgi:SAM-dependent methyltransferase